MKYKTSSIVTLVLLLAAGGTSLQAMAQTATDNFSMPSAVPAGTKIQIDGSDSMQAVNQGLKSRFQKQFPGTDITLPSKYQGSDAGIKAVETGKVDLASIGRLITTSETARGIAAKEIGRSKIAIIVKDNNPYQGNLTLKDFAKIYRGEITNWSQLASSKGAKGKIKVIDRPNSSDTRRAFANYPVFQNGKLKTGSNAEKLTEDSTPAMVAKLGQNDIGYAPADQVKNIPGVRAITLHGTQPDNPKYPFSQPLVYAYNNKDGKVTDGAKAFLGYVSDPTGQTGINESIAAGVAATGAATATIDPNPVNDNNSTSITKTDDVVVPSTPELSTTTNSVSNTGIFPWWWMLPVLAAGGGLLWWLNRKKTTATTYRTSPSYSVPTRKSTETISGGASSTENRSSSGYIPTGTSTAKIESQRATVENLAPDLRQVWLAVNNDPTNFESIVTRSQHSEKHVTNALSQLESLGLVTQLPGRKYQRSH
jgi:phosphate transport system substrate-binding protein